MQEGHFPSMDEWGIASQEWMVERVLEGSDTSYVREGVIHMIRYMNQHFEHLESGDEDCPGPDWHKAQDILVQISTTGMYIEPYDPDDYPDGPPPIPRTAEDIEKSVRDFNQVLNGIPTTDDEEEK